MRARAARVAFFGALVLSVSSCRRGRTCDASDPVSLELCGPRKEWVGQWLEVSAQQRWIDIGPHGGYRFGDNGPLHHRRVEGDIIGFSGDDLMVRTNDDAGEKLLVRVTDPPHEGAEGWRMTVEGSTYYRSAP